MENTTVGRSLLNRRSPLKRSTGDILFSSVLIAPTLFMTIVYILIPVVDSVVKSFLDFKVKNIISGKPGTWNNFAN